MKMVKSLLLASAAGVVAVAGAQAADLPVKAKPVEYVRICTLYGDGFYNSQVETLASGSPAISGPTTTLTVVPQMCGAPGAQDRTVSRFGMRHRANFAVDTRTQTAYGTLRTFMNVNFDNDFQSDTVQATRAFIQWGGFTIGRTASFNDHEGSLGDSGFSTTFTNLLDPTTGDAGINQIAYTWQLGNCITLHVPADNFRDQVACQPADHRCHSRQRSDQLPPTATRIPIRGLRCGSMTGAAPASPSMATRMPPPTTPHRCALHSDRHDVVRPSGRQVGLGGQGRHRGQA